MTHTQCQLNKISTCAPKVNIDYDATQRVTRSKSSTHVAASSNTRSSKSSSSFSSKPQKSSSQPSKLKPSKKLPCSSSSSSLLPLLSSPSVSSSSSNSVVVIPSPNSPFISDDEYDFVDSSHNNNDANDPSFSDPSQSSSSSEDIASSDSDSDELNRNHHRRVRRSLRNSSLCRRYFQSILEKDRVLQLERQLQQGIENVDNLNSHEYREYLECNAFDDLIHKKILYRKIPAACQDRFISLARMHLRYVSHALSSKDESSIFSAIMNLLLLPSKTLVKCRAGGNRKRNRKADIINKRIDYQIATFNNNINNNNNDDNNINAFNHDNSTFHGRSGKNSEEELNVLSSSSASTSLSSSEHTNDDEASSLRRNVNGAVSLIDDAYVSKGMKRLCSKPRARINFEQIYNNLLLLHPQNDVNAPPLPSNCESFMFDGEDSRFYKHMKRMDTGTLPGLSGWSGNMLSVIAEDKDCRGYFAHFMCEVMNGALPRNASNVLLASLLIGIPKDNGGTRPIAIGEIFVRFASSFALSFIDTKVISNFFLPHQYGVNFKWL